jgi:multidrug efflux system outer membrane protein
VPKDAIPKGNWWELYHDTELNGLELDLLQANQSLKAAQDRLLQARSLARVATAGFFPTLSADPNGARQRVSGNRPLEGASPTVQTPRCKRALPILATCGWS